VWAAWREMYKKFPGLFVIIAFYTFKQSINGHGMSMPQVEIFFDLFYNVTGFYSWFKFSVLGKAFLLRHFLKVRRPLACF
jgi:hypothetical protein